MAVNDPTSGNSITVSAWTEPQTYLVEVRARETSRHHVSVSPAYLRQLGLDNLPASRVLNEAFMFLLEREPNTSILSRFDLRDIERYFPEFREAIAQRLRS